MIPDPENDDKLDTDVVAAHKQSKPAAADPQSQGAAAGPELAKQDGVPKASEKRQGASEDEPQKPEDPEGSQGSEEDENKEQEGPESPKPKVASLWCSKNGRSHAALYTWEIFKCPACGENLRPLEGRVGRSRRRRRVSSSSRSFSNSSSGSSYHGPPRPGVGPIPGTPMPPGMVPLNAPQMPPMHSVRPMYGMDPFHPRVMPPPSNGQVPAPPPDVNYRIKFLFESGALIGTRPYHELLDLDKERKAIVNVSDPVLEIITVVQTNIAVRKYIPPPELERLSRQYMSEGILRNPRYDVEVIERDIKIRSRQIIDVLKKIVGYYPGVLLTAEVVILEEPYCLAFHHMTEIEAYLETPTEGGELSDEASQARDKETRRHLKVFSDACWLHYRTLVDEETSRHRKPTPMATFQMLWLLFKPGTTVYIQMDRGLQACVVERLEFTYHEICRLSNSYMLVLWYLNSDGRKVGRCQCKRIISPYEGERKITSLNVFPAEFLDASDGGETRKRLESRGEKFYKYLRGAHVYYSGESLGPEGRWYDGRAIIDIASYRNYGIEKGYDNNIVFSKPTIGRIKDNGIVESDSSSGSSSSSDSSDESDEEDTTKSYDVKSPWRDYNDIDPKYNPTLELVDPVTGNVNKHRYLLLPKKVIGFILKSRNWEQLDIECCHEPKNNWEAIDTLVMSEERKTMIKALVYRYTDRDRDANVQNQGTTPWAADFIENKGDGQIFLLHGSPGVGKTYTAECIAESTGRPLLSLTCGDIGNDEEELERRLSKWFRLAEVWGAVMLLDEADVFLERRAAQDLQRNSLVSVFLRTMEYYRGILFLTTNRVGHFDDAFISRIHVVIRYESFTNAERERIWTQFFDKLRKERGKYIEISRKAIRYVTTDPEMTSIPWNGREIRNTFQTAVALAEYRFAHLANKEEDEKARLEREDFEQVCEMTGAFKGYLQSVTGLDESQRARSELARNDSFTETR